MAGNCPECGVDLWDSLEGYRLKYADPTWVRGLYQGTIRFCVAMVLIIGWHITAIVRDDLDVCLDYMWSLRPDPEFGWSIVIMGFAYVISPPISMLLLTLGAFQCTRPRPGSLTTREARLKQPRVRRSGFRFRLVWGCLVAGRMDLEFFLGTHDLVFSVWNGIDLAVDHARHNDTLASNRIGNPGPFHHQNLEHEPVRVGPLADVLSVPASGLFTVHHRDRVLLVGGPGHAGFSIAHNHGTASATMKSNIA